MSDRVSDGEVLGRNAYAAHQGVTPGAVAKAIKSGRITKAVIWGKGGRVQGIRVRLADELWTERTDLREALKSRKQPGPAPARAPAALPPAVQTSAPAPTPRPAQGEEALPLPKRRLLEQRQVSEVLGAAFGTAAVAWAAMMCHRFEVTADFALNVIEDGLLCVNDAVGSVLGIPPDSELQMHVPDLLRAAMHGDGRTRLLQQIEAAAPTLEA